MTNDGEARRAAMVLAVAQALYSSATIILVATAGLVGAQLAPSMSWATLPASFFVIGTALTTLPASLLMKVIGRKAGFMLGSLVGAAGGLIGIYAIYQRSFLLFLVTALCQGVFQASSQYFRFAAADAATPAFKPKAISWVMIGGVAAAIFGTLIVIETTDLFAPVAFAGCYLAMTVLSILTMAVLAFLKLPEPHAEEVSHNARSLLEIVRQPRFIVAVVVGMLSYGIMNLVMTATPVAMIGCGFGIADSSWVIQWHVLAMFVPSFFTGGIIQRFGVERVIAFGLLLLACAAVSGLLGIRFENFAVGLIFLGLGWNFGFVGATTMLANVYRGSERSKIQGFNDFCIFGTTAVASLSAGKLLDAFGWNAVNYAVFPLILIALVIVGWLVTQQKPELQKS